MPVRHYRRDPRGKAEKRADEEVLRLFEGGGFLKGNPKSKEEHPRGPSKPDSNSRPNRANTV